MSKKYFAFLLLCFISFSAFAQPTVLYSSINSSPRVVMADLGLFKQGRMQANQSGYQRWAFHMGTVATPDYNQNWRVGSIPNVLSFGNYIPSSFSNGANYFTAGGGIDGELNGVVSGNYYTFNILKNASASNDMELLETNFNPTVISSVSQSPLAASVIANSSVAVSITMASAPAVGEFVYLRYSTDAFVTSSIIQATFTGNVSTVNIPCRVAGTTVSYYVFSSNETLAGLNSDLIAFGTNCYDLATLNLNNNGGPNYNYTVSTPPPNTISYNATPYCSNAGIANVTNTGTLGGIYSSTAGLSINATTGAITLASSTAGAYTVTYTIAPSGSCALYTSTTPITITAAPSATISYTGSPYCSNVATAAVTRTGTTGGVYSSTAGLSLNASTGAVNIATSTAGTYTVTYTIAAAGGCAIFTTNAPITITAAPSATISYAGSPYCSNVATATVTRTGTTGGVYSSTTGLSLNATTGDVNVATSTAGTYTVTYTIAAAGGCAIFTTTAPITITAAPSATISYAGSPYCSNVATAAVTRTGTTGGVYSSTAGLSLNASTGAVNIATSTAGTYTVTYTIAAAGGCAIFTTNAPITITAAPSATISYAGSPYCSNVATATVTRTGTTGGVYSSTTGLSLNATTGDVNIATSNAGTYTVTYTIVAAGGCAIFTTTAPITITAAPSATINYAGSPYCSNVATAAVTRTGTTGGIYSSTTGLSLNATTGEVNIATSTAGTYTVTYTVAAAGGCAIFTTTAPIIITATPSATISYGSTPYCINSGTANVIRTGTTGGVFSSTTGLTINATTGIVNLATSTAGTYTVTYTIAAAGGCATVTTTASITIIAALSATINYASNPYCSGTATVTRTGNGGGIYSSTTGLVINATTGDVDASTSTAGTYVVTYTLAASGGCTAFSTTANITINTLSTAPTSATASRTLICGNSGSVNLTAIGGTAGTGASYKWYTGTCGGTLIGTGATLNNIAVNNTTNFFVRIEGTCNTTICQTVTVVVAPQPVVEIIAPLVNIIAPFAPVTIFAKVTPVDNYDYVWSKNNNINLTTNTDRIVVFAAEAKSHSVVVTSSSGCTASALGASLTTTAVNSLFVYPNPNRGIFNVSYFNGDFNTGSYTLNIFDSKGAKVFNQSYNLNPSYRNMRVDLRNTAKGTYFVVLLDVSGKIIAEKKVAIL
jgi:Ig-like domain CHU_C associated/Secretion system C-terminal sorting domain